MFLVNDLLSELLLSMKYADHIEEQSMSSEVGAAESWVGAIAVCRASDLAASRIANGRVQLWALEDTNRVLQPRHKLPVVIASHFSFSIILALLSFYKCLL